MELDHEEHEGHEGYNLINCPKGRISMEVMRMLMDGRFVIELENTGNRFVSWTLRVLVE